MAAWLTVLKLVPWGEVIKGAPVVVDGARKLWDTVGRKPPSAPTMTSGAGSDPATSMVSTPAAGGEAQAWRAVQALKARMEQAEADLVAMHAQMQDSSALIKALAEQNAELVQRVESHRLRLRWLLAAVVALAAIATAALVMAR